MHGSQQQDSDREDTVMVNENEGLVLRGEGSLIANDDILSPVMNLALAKKRLAEFQGFVKEYLVENEDFGVIPGTPKPTLLKPGADKLCELYGLADSYEIVDKVEEYDAKPPLFDYTIRCTLVRLRTGQVIATGLGSCSTYESRYRWRKGSRKCPKCGQETIIKGKAEYGGGWLCFAKKGGCGAKFPDGDKSIESQSAERLENEDIIDQKNTVLKMAKKRAKIDATLSATRSSGVFTQDVEDMPAFREEPKPQPQQPRQAQRPAPAKHTEDVICAQCGNTNGHTADCPTQQKQQAAVPQGQNRRFVNVDSVAIKKSKKNTPFAEVCGVTRDGEKLKLYAYEKEIVNRAEEWKGLWCDFALESRPSADGKKTFITLLSVFNVNGTKYVDNKPVPAAEEGQYIEDQDDPTGQPTAGEMGF
jgi:hypothetical protein